MITLITGGIKSGKSAYALKLANQQTADRPQKGIFIATADSTDISLQNKIALHKKQREGSIFTTIEEKIDIDVAIKNLDPSCEIILIDCLTLWMANLLFFKENRIDRDQKINSLIHCLEKLTAPCILVTNEVGLGIIPENKLAREYQEELGILNYKIANIANSVLLMISGIPVKIK